MESLKRLFRDKENKVIKNIAVCLAAGIILLILGNTVLPSGVGTNSAVSSYEVETATISDSNTDLSYEADLEKRLESILSEAAGAGQVKVMVKLSYGREIVVAEDTISDTAETKEVDANGGSREISNQSIENKTLIIPGTNGGKPLVLKEIEPKIEGVIIIAEGGDDILVKDVLIKAAQTVLGVEPHKVQVLRMKDKN